jgi:hypothetical protein
MYTIPDASSLPDNGGILKGPADKGSDPYVQWISRLWMHKPYKITAVHLAAPEV